MADTRSPLESTAQATRASLLAAAVITTLHGCSLFKTIKPWTERGSFSLDDEHGRSCTMHEQLIAALADVMVMKGVPEHLRSDNGPEFVAQGPAEMAGRDGSKDAVHRARLSLGERLLRELQLQAEGRVPERRDLLLDEGAAACWQNAGGFTTTPFRPHSSLGYRPPAPEAWRTHPRRRLFELEDTCQEPEVSTARSVRVATKSGPSTGSGGRTSAGNRRSLRRAGTQRTVLSRKCPTTALTLNFRKA